VESYADLCISTSETMPSKKALTRGTNAKSHHKKGQVSVLRASDKSVSQAQSQPISKTYEGQDLQLDCKISSCQSTVSTDEGSSMSDCSSPMVSSASPAASSSIPVHIYAPNRPLWMDNGMKGDKAAWLLVLPKSRCNNQAEESSVPVLKSPKDATLLGPYVTMKNTFLDESRVDGALHRRCHQRSKSWTAR